MIASRVFVDGWGAAKLAPDDEGNVLVETALMQILDERADTLVKQRQVLAQRAKIVSVMVPAAEGEGDTARAGLDQSAGDEHMFHQLRTPIVAILRVAFAIAVADFCVFFFEVQGIEKLAGSEDAKGLFIESIQRFHHAAAVEIATKLIEAGEQRSAISEAIKRDAIQHHVVLAAAFIWLERRMGHSQKAGHAVVRPFHMAHFRGEADEWRDRSVHRAVKL